VDAAPEQKKDEAPKPDVAPQPPAQKVETNVKKDDPKPNGQEPPKKIN
jgi:hypothetical protein